MTNGDREGRVFQSHFHTYKGFFFLLTTKYLLLYVYWKKTWKRLPENFEYAEMRHGDVILTLQWRHGSKCGQRVADVRLIFFFYFSLGLVRVWVKNNGNPIWCARIALAVHIQQILSMTGKCNNHRPQVNPKTREEETQNTTRHKTPRTQSHKVKQPAFSSSARWLQN